MVTVADGGQAEEVDETVERLRECVAKGLPIEDGGTDFLLDGVAVRKDKKCVCPWFARRADSKDYQRTTLAALVFVVQFPPPNTWSQYSIASKEAGVHGLSMMSWQRAKTYFGVGRSIASPKDPRNRSPARKPVRSPPSQSPPSISPHRLALHNAATSSAVDTTLHSMIPPVDDAAMTPERASAARPEDKETASVEGNGGVQDDDMDGTSDGCVTVAGRGATSASAGSAVVVDRENGFKADDGSVDAPREVSGRAVDETLVDTARSNILRSIERGLFVVHEEVGLDCKSIGASVDLAGAEGTAAGDNCGSRETGESYGNDLAREHTGSAAALSLPSLGPFPFSSSPTKDCLATPAEANKTDEICGGFTLNSHTEASTAPPVQLARRPPPGLPPPAPGTGAVARGFCIATDAMPFARPESALRTALSSTTAATTRIRDPAEAAALAMARAAAAAAAAAATGGCGPSELESDNDSGSRVRAKMTTTEYARRQEDACQATGEAVAEAVLSRSDSSSPPRSPPPPPPSPLPTAAGPPRSPVRLETFHLCSSQSDPDSREHVPQRQVSSDIVSPEFRDEEHATTVTSPPPSDGNILVSPERLGIVGHDINRGQGSSRIYAPASTLPKDRADASPNAAEPEDIGCRSPGSVESRRFWKEKVALTQEDVKKLGAVVRTRKDKIGAVRFCGGTEFAAGLWLGIEVDGPGGKNDGSHHLRRYFTCPPGRGLFVPANDVVLHSPAKAATGEGTGPEGDDKQADPGGVVGAEVTAKSENDGDESRATASLVQHASGGNPIKDGGENLDSPNVEKRTPLSPRHSLNSTDGLPSLEELGTVDIQAVLALERQQDEEESMLDDKAGETAIAIGKDAELGRATQGFSGDGDGRADVDENTLHVIEHLEPSGDDTGRDDRTVLKLTFSPGMTALDLTHAATDNCTTGSTSSVDEASKGVWAGETAGALAGPLQRLDEKRQRASMSLATVGGGVNGKAGVKKARGGNDAKQTRRLMPQRLQAEASEGVSDVGEMESVRLLSPSTNSPPKSGVDADISSCSRGARASNLPFADHCLSAEPSAPQVRTDDNKTDEGSSVPSRVVTFRLPPQAVCTPPGENAPTLSTPPSTHVPSPISDTGGGVDSAAPAGKPHQIGSAIFSADVGVSRVGDAGAEKKLSGSGESGGRTDYSSQASSSNKRKGPRKKRRSLTATAQAEAAAVATAVTAEKTHVRRLRLEKGRKGAGATPSSDIPSILSPSSCMPSKHAPTGAMGSEAKSTTAKSSAVRTGSSSSERQKLSGNHLSPCDSRERQAHKASSGNDPCSKTRNTATKRASSASRSSSANSPRAEAVTVDGELRLTEKAVAEHDARTSEDSAQTPWGIPAAEPELVGEHPNAVTMAAGEAAAGSPQEDASATGEPRGDEATELTRFDWFVIWLFCFVGMTVSGVFILRESGMVPGRAGKVVDSVADDFEVLGDRALITVSETFARAVKGFETMVNDLANSERTDEGTNGKQDAQGEEKETSIRRSGQVSYNPGKRDPSRLRVTFEDNAKKQPERSVNSDAPFSAHRSTSAAHSSWNGLHRNYGKFYDILDEKQERDAHGVAVEESVADGRGSDDVDVEPTEDSGTKTTVDIAETGSSGGQSSEARNAARCDGMSAAGSGPAAAYNGDTSEAMDERLGGIADNLVGTNAQSVEEVFTGNNAMCSRPMAALRYGDVGQAFSDWETDQEDGYHVADEAVTAHEVEIVDEEPSAEAAPSPLPIAERTPSQMTLRDEAPAEAKRNFSPLVELYSAALDVNTEAGTGDISEWDKNGEAPGGENSDDEKDSTPDEEEMRPDSAEASGDEPSFTLGDVDMADLLVERDGSAFDAEKEPDFHWTNGSMVPVTFLNHCGEKARRPSSPAGCIPMRMVLGYETKKDLVLREGDNGGQLMWKSHKSTVTRTKTAVWGMFAFGQKLPPKACRDVYLSAAPDGQLVLLYPDKSASGGGTSVDYGMVIGFANGAGQHVIMRASGGCMCVFSRGGTVRWVSRGVNKWNSYEHPRGSSIDGKASARATASPL